MQQILDLEKYVIRSDEKGVGFCIGDAIHGCLGPVSDFRHTLHESERAQIAGSVAKRQIEYSAGRHYARNALASLGFGAVAIGRRETRAPEWPSGVIGSITHSDDLAAAIVSRFGRPYRGIGIDTERDGRVTPDMFPFVLSGKEQHLRERAAGVEATLLFSAKEAVFKAVNPLVGNMIEFVEVEIDFSDAARNFRAHYIGRNADNGIINTGIGKYSVFGRNILSIFVL